MEVPGVPVLGARLGGEDAPLLPLKLCIVGAATEEEMNANVTATIQRGYVRFNEYLECTEGVASIVGAGPSIKNTIKDIKGDVLAINSAIGYVLDHGIVPKWAMIWDCHELCETFAVPHPDVTYLIGARCHPKVFERLKGCKVVVWHAGGDHNILEYMQKNNINEPLINGGTAGVTRGLYLAAALGYREFHVFGADSSYSDDGDTHVRGSVVPEKDMNVWVNGKWFRTTPEWCAQVEEIKLIYPIFQLPPLSGKITVHGEGLFPYIVELMKADEAAALANARAVCEAAIKQNAESIHDARIGPQ